MPTPKLLVFKHLSPILGVAQVSVPRDAIETWRSGCDLFEERRVDVSAALFLLLFKEALDIGPLKVLRTGCVGRAHLLFEFGRFECRGLERPVFEAHDAGIHPLGYQGRQHLQKERRANWAWEVAEDGQCDRRR